MNKILSVLLLFLILGNQSCLIKHAKYTANDAYQKKQYALAIERYKDSMKKNDKYNSIDVFNLARSYTATMDYDNAIKYHKLAAEMENKRNYSTYFALSLMKAEQYQLAITIFEKVSLDFGVDAEVKRKIQMCKQAMIWKEKKVSNRYKISLVDFNTSYMDYSPSYHEGAIYYSSDRIGGTGDATYNWMGNYYSDIYIEDVKGTATSPYDININSDDNEGALCFNTKGNEVFYTRCNNSSGGNQYCKIMLSNRVEGYWEESIQLSFFGDQVNEVHPCLIESDSVLIFSANPLDNNGGYDLYYAVRSTNGWSEALPLSDKINTLGDEKFPNAHNDTLYYSSDYLLGMGGLDIFKTYLSADYNWVTPINLEAPINSGYDDFSFVVNPDFAGNELAVQSGLFTSNRPGGEGLDDIYQFVKTISIQEDGSIDLDTVEEYQVFVNFKIVNKKNQIIENVFITEKKPPHGLSFRNDRYFFVPIADRQYRYMFGANGYLSQSKEVMVGSSVFDALDRDTTINYIISLESYELNKEIVLENIYYDFNKYDLRDEAKLSLNKLVKILKDNPKISIELASHTDCNGEDDYNIELSQNRAQSAVDYIIQNGIDQSRLTAKGYGESILLINCDCSNCSDEENQQNRRTSFKVMN